jgi:hypothetical protein
MAVIRRLGSLLRAALFPAVILCSWLGAPPATARADGAGEAPAAIDAERGRLLGELAAVRHHLLRRATGCAGEDAGDPARREACARARVRLREAGALAAEIRAAAGPEAASERGVVLPLERWRHAVGLLRREAAGPQSPASISPPADRPRAAGSAAAEGLGVIEGQVTDAVTGDPISDVFVFIFDAVGSFVTFGVTDPTGFYVSFDGLATGSYFAYSDNSAGHLDEVYDDIPCPSFCDPTTGTPIAVSGGGTTSGIDFALDPGGAITGTVTDAVTGAPLAGVSIDVWDAATGSSVTSGFTDPAGVYVTFGGLQTGSFVATTFNDASYLNELYDDIPCPFFFSCDRTTGTPIAVTVGTTTAGIDFALAKGGAVAGTVTVAGSGAPVDSFVDLFDSVGNFATSAFSGGAAGAWVSSAGLPTGNYHAVTFAFGDLLINELYDDLPCPFGCVVTAGTPIPVTVGATTGSVDFALTVGGGLAGTATAEATGGPVTNLEVGLHDGLGVRVASFFTQFDGGYATFSGVPPGTYYARTLNGRALGLADERFDDLPCLSLCPALSGTPIAVAAGASTTGIDFSMAPRPLFYDSFESGGLGFWDAAAGTPGCVHSMCAEGAALSSACDPCVQTVCSVDPFCCNVAWDGICVFEVRFICELECP